MMWSILFVVGVGMAIDPVRIGFAIVMLSQRRPFRSLMAFWLGGVAAGAAIGLAALVLMRELTTTVLHFIGDIFNWVRTTTVVFEGGRFQIAIGVLSLMMLAKMMKRSRATAKLAAGGGHTVALVEERPGNLFQRLGERTHNVLSGDRMWPAFVIGLSSSFPPYEGWVVVAFIGASSTGVLTQFSTFMLFIFMVLAVIEIPLICHLLAPSKTQAIMEVIQDWTRRYRLQITKGILAFTGVTFLYTGIAAL